MWKRTYLLHSCNTADSRDTLYIRGQTDYLVFAIDCTFENLQTILCFSSTVHSKTCRLSCVCHRLYIRRQTDYLVFAIDCTFENLQTILCLSSTVHSKTCRLSCVCHRLYIRRPAGYLVFVIDCTFEDLQAIWCLSSTVHSICRWSAVQTILCLLSFFVHLLVILKMWIFLTN